jgi:uncharacterized protein (TIGR00730 family)
MPTVTVYGSSSPRTPAAYLAVAARVGRLVAGRGWTLVTGAGKEGCMGACADACLAAGGQVRGVILRRFAEQGLQHPSLAEVAVAEDMRTRKRLLAEGADAFIALPGGPGTWEELWEIAVQRQIGATSAPLVGVDVDGCYAGFRACLARAEADGLLYGPACELVAWVEDADAAVARALSPVTR